MVVSFEPRGALSRLARGLPSAFRFLSNPDRSLYRLYGVEEGGWLRIFSPGTLLYYARAILRGGLGSGPRRAPGETTEIRQLGADFLIDSAGVLRMVHRSRNPADRPSIDELERRIGALRGDGGRGSSSQSD